MSNHSQVMGRSGHHVLSALFSLTVLLVGCTSDPAVTYVEQQRDHLRRIEAIVDRHYSELSVKADAWKAVKAEPTYQRGNRARQSAIFHEFETVWGRRLNEHAARCWADMGAIAASIRMAPTEGLPAAMTAAHYEYSAWMDSSVQTASRRMLTSNEFSDRLYAFSERFELLLREHQAQ